MTANQWSDVLEHVGRVFLGAGTLACGYGLGYIGAGMGQKSRFMAWFYTALGVIAVSFMMSGGGKAPTLPEFLGLFITLSIAAVFGVCSSWGKSAQSDR